MAWNGPWRAGLSGYDVTLPCGSESAQRRHAIKGEECAACGVPQDPPDMASNCVTTACDGGGSETGTKWSLGDLLSQPAATVCDDFSGGLTLTHPEQANA